MKLEMLSWYQKTCDIVPRKLDNRVKRAQVEAMTKNLPEESKKEVFRRYEDGLTGLPLSLFIQEEKKRSGLN